MVDLEIEEMPDRNTDPELRFDIPVDEFEFEQGMLPAQRLVDLQSAEGGLFRASLHEDRADSHDVQLSREEGLPSLHSLFLPANKGLKRVGESNLFPAAAVSAKEVFDVEKSEFVGLPVLQIAGDNGCVREHDLLSCALHTTTIRAFRGMDGTDIPAILIEEEGQKSLVVEADIDPAGELAFTSGRSEARLNSSAERLIKDAENAVASLNLVLIPFGESEYTVLASPENEIPDYMIPGKIDRITVSSSSLLSRRVLDKSLLPESMQKRSVVEQVEIDDIAVNSQAQIELRDEAPVPVVKARVITDEVQDEFTLTLDEVIELLRNNTGKYAHESDVERTTAFAATADGKAVLFRNKRTYALESAVLDRVQVAKMLREAANAFSITANSHEQMQSIWNQGLGLSNEALARRFENSLLAHVESAVSEGMLHGARVRLARHFAEKELKPYLELIEVKGFGALDEIEDVQISGQIGALFGNALEAHTATLLDLQHTIEADDHEDYEDLLKRVEKGEVPEIAMQILKDCYTAPLENKMKLAKILAGRFGLDREIGDDDSSLLATEEVSSIIREFTYYSLDLIAHGARLEELGFDPLMMGLSAHQFSVEEREGRDVNSVLSFVSQAPMQNRLDLVKSILESRICKQYWRHRGENITKEMVSLLSREDQLKIAAEGVGELEEFIIGDKREFSTISLAKVQHLPDRTKMDLIRRVMDHASSFRQLSDREFDESYHTFILQISSFLANTPEYLAAFSWVEMPEILPLDHSRLAHNRNEYDWYWRGSPLLPNRRLDSIRDAYARIAHHSGDGEVMFGMFERWYQDLLFDGRDSERYGGLAGDVQMRLDYLARKVYFLAPMIRSLPQSQFPNVARFISKDLEDLHGRLYRSITEKNLRSADGTMQVASDRVYKAIKSVLFEGARELDNDHAAARIPKLRPVEIDKITKAQIYLAMNDSSLRFMRWIFDDIREDFGLDRDSVHASTSHLRKMIHEHREI